MARPAAGRDTKGEILDVAWRMIADRGFAATSLADICRVVRLSKASLLHHYPSKEKLYTAVLEEVAAELREVIAASEGGSAKAELLGIAIRIEAWAKRRPPSLRLVMRDMIDRVGEANAGDAHVWPLRFFVAHLEELFHAARDESPDGRLSRLEFSDFLSLFLGPLIYRQLAEPVIAGMQLADAPGAGSSLLLYDLAGLLSVGSELG